MDQMSKGDDTDRVLKRSIESMLAQSKQIILHDYCSGRFDGSIGRQKQSNDPDYLKGYYEGLKQFLGW